MLHIHSHGQCHNYAVVCRVHEYEEKVRSLSIELVQVRARLQAAEKKANEPPPLLLKLQEELSQMKVIATTACPLCEGL